MRFRPGDERLGAFTEDSLTVQGSDVIIDHCSASWSVDEVLSMGGSPFDDVTIQYCVIAQALSQTGYFHGEYNPNYLPGGPSSHGFGSLFKPSGGSGVIGNMTAHHNLWALNDNRNPAVGTYGSDEIMRIDFRNNVLYGNDRNGYSSGDSLRVEMNYVGNYIIAGPETDWDWRYRAFDANPDNHCHIYQSGNKVDGDRDGHRDGVDTGWSMFVDTYTKEYTPYAFEPVNTQSADEAYTTVLADVGARPWRRDTVDAGIISNVINETGYHINSQSEVGGWPDLLAGLGPKDSDADGMPDYWENHYGYNAKAPDGTGDRDGDGYTNLEEYLNWLTTDDPFVGRITLWTNAGSGSWSLGGNWDGGAPGAAETAYVNNGGVAQVTGGGEVRSLFLGSNAGTSGTVMINGDLEVAAVFGAGLGGSGTVDHRGGTVNLGGDLYLGCQAGATGSYVLRGGLLNMPEGTIRIGLDGYGQFGLLAGTVIADEIVRGPGGLFDEAGVGSVCINAASGLGGAMSFGELRIGHAGGRGAGEVTVGAGQSLTLNDRLVVGSTATGTLRQTDGSVLATHELLLGEYVGAEGTYHLAGGTLQTPVIQTGLGDGTLELTGGTLRTGQIDVDFLNAGARFEPGLSIAEVTINGGYTQTAGATVVELADLTDHDTLIVSGPANLGGQLWMESVGGYRPREKDTFAVMSAGSFSGAFAGILTNLRGGSPGWQAAVVGQELILTFLGRTAGDANYDHRVSLGDLSIMAGNWQQPGSWLQGDFNNDGVVSIGDLSMMAANWGWERRPVDDGRQLGLGTAHRRQYPRTGHPGPADLRGPGRPRPTSPIGSPPYCSAGSQGRGHRYLTGLRCRRLILPS